MSFGFIIVFMISIIMIKVVLFSQPLPFVIIYFWWVGGEKKEVLRYISFPKITQNSFFLIFFNF